MGWRQLDRRRHPRSRAGTGLSVGPSVTRIVTDGRVRGAERKPPTGSPAVCRAARSVREFLGTPAIGFLAASAVRAGSWRSERTSASASERTARPRFTTGELAAS